MGSPADVSQDLDQFRNHRAVEGRSRSAQGDAVAARESSDGAEDGQHRHRPLYHPGKSPVLLGYQRLYRGVVRPALGLKEPPTALAGTWLVGTRVDRFASFWARVRRAVFDSPGVFEFEVEDKYRPERRYIGTLKLRGWEWKLTGLAVAGNGL